MTLNLETIPLTVFAAVMAIAAFEDFRRLVIPNLLPIVLCAFWPIYFAASPSLYGALGALGCAAAIFLVGALLFARGYLGGGDVKLLAAAALWAGPANTPALLMLTAILGGVLALLLLPPLSRRAVERVRVLLRQPPAAMHGGPAVAVPYGVAIAGAALIVTLSPHIG